MSQKIAQDSNLAQIKKQGSKTFKSMILYVFLDQSTVNKWKLEPLYFEVKKEIFKCIPLYNCLIFDNLVTVVVESIHTNDMCVLRSVYSY